MKIPGMSFSWKRALGVSKIKQNISRAIGIPMTRSGLEKKIGNAVLKTIFGNRKQTIMDSVIKDFAKAWESLNPELIIKHLDPNFQYDSQWAF